MFSERNAGDIYYIRNLINNKIYVGQCVKYYSSGRKNGYLSRYRRHIREALNGTSYCVVLANAIRKYGEVNFEIIPLLSCKKEKLDDYEDYFIELFNTLSPNGYNLMTSRVGYKIADSTRAKLSSHKLTEERKQQISEFFTGKCFQDRKNKLPMYIYLIINGYEVRYKHNRKLFTAQKYSMEEKRELAEKYLQDILKIENWSSETKS